MKKVPRPGDCMKVQGLSFFLGEDYVFVPEAEARKKKEAGDSFWGSLNLKGGEIKNEKVSGSKTTREKALS